MVKSNSIKRRCVSKRPLYSLMGWNKLVKCCRLAMTRNPIIVSLVTLPVGHNEVHFDLCLEGHLFQVLWALQLQVRLPLELQPNLLGDWIICCGWLKFHTWLNLRHHDGSFDALCCRPRPDPHRFWQAHLHRESGRKCRELGRERDLVEKWRGGDGRAKSDVRVSFAIQNTTRNIS